MISPLHYLILENGAFFYLLLSRGCMNFPQPLTLSNLLAFHLTSWILGPSNSKGIIPSMWTDPF